jgi:anti-sigma factor RsiW
VDRRETQTLLHGYVDGELDLMKSLEIEEHLEECPACTRAHASLQAVRAAIRGSSLRLQAPTGLERRVRSAVRTAGRDDRTPRRRPRLRRLLAVAASLALVVSAGWGLARLLPVRPGNTPLVDELVASHVRAQLIPAHRIDVVSTDPHTVKPWFQGKLDYAPPTVQDLGAQGFPLVGGRLDYLRKQRVAVLVYLRRDHPIDLFVWPSPPGPETKPNPNPMTSRSTRQGYHLIEWSQSGLTYWAVSELNERELLEFVRLIQGQA